MSNPLALNPQLESTLPFDKIQQYALLGHILDYSNTSIFLQVKDRLLPEWFMDPYAAKLYDLYRKFYEEYKHTPASTEELMTTGETRWMDQLERAKVYAAEQNCREHVAKFSPDTLLNELTQWMRVRVYHQSVEKSAALFDRRQLAEAFAVLEQTVKEYQSIRFDGVAPTEIWDWKSIVTARLEQLGEALSTGLPILDKKLNPDAKSGALILGESSLWLAGTNAGKTTFMQTLIQHNVKVGKKCLWITLEGNEAAMREMMWCGILKMTRDMFREFAMSSDPNHIAAFQGISTIIRDRLVHLHSQKAGQTAEEVEAMIRSHQSRLKAENGGKGFDLVVLDYPAVLSSGAKNINMQLREETKRIYRRFFDLAGEEKFHLATAIQSNRDAIRESRGLGQKGNKNRLLTKESVAEAWGVVHDAPMVATLNRTDEDAANNLLTVYIDKSRNGETGWAVTCRTDYSRARTHGESLGGFAYRGSSSLAEKANSFLDSFKNQELPRETLLEAYAGRQ